jgi:hypothetical protein
MTEHAYEIYYESRELHRELNEPLLGIVRATSPEEAVKKAWRDPKIQPMPCCSLWAVRVRDEEKGTGQAQSRPRG